MKKGATPYLAVEIVAKAVLTALWGQPAADLSSTRLSGTPQLLSKLWSTLYFLPVSNAGERQDLVVKIAHFPDQTTPEPSWQSEELLRRGQREFETMERIASHFTQQPDPLLSALQPRAYLPEINAIVMDFVKGQPLYDECFTGQGVLTNRGRRRAEKIMHRTGCWLRHFHHLPLENVPPKRLHHPGETFEAILAVVDTLSTLGINPTAWPHWNETLAFLRQVNPPEVVWTHGDFHLRNVFVFYYPHDGVLGLDTALERVDSPYFDLGKFIADLKTRRGVILSRGLFPPLAVTQSLIKAFLSGYLAGEPLAVLPLALYEGRFILEKWVQSLTVIDQKFYGRSAPMGAAVRVLVNSSFQRIVSQWLQTVNQAASAQAGFYRLQEDHSLEVKYP